MKDAGVRLKPFHMNDAKMALSESRQDRNGSSESIFCTLEELIYIYLPGNLSIFFCSFTLPY